MNLDYVRRRFQDLNDEELLREAVLEGDGFRPEALAVLKEELALRSQSLSHVLSEERSVTGVLMDRIGDVRRFTRRGSRRGEPAVGPATGYLLLTSGGVGFVATKMEAAWSLAGALGEWATSLPVSDWMRGSPLDVKHRDLPVSMLARLHAGTSWFPREEIQRIGLAKGKLRITASVEAMGVIPPDGDLIFHRWAGDLDLPIDDVQGRLAPGDDPERRAGLWRRIFR